ncbi:MAG: transposase [Acetobacter sp.]|nr:transposase [Acetobacter sp.]
MVVSNKEYASNVFREHVRSMGARSVIPLKHRDAAVSCPQWAYRDHHRVKNLWALLKEWRAVATRYEKTTASSLATLHLAGRCRLDQNLTEPNVCFWKIGQLK